MMIVMADGGTTQVIEEQRLVTPRAPLTLPNLKALQNGGTVKVNLSRG